MTELTKLTLKDTISFCLQLIQLRKKKKISEFVSLPHWYFKCHFSKFEFLLQNYISPL